MLQLNPLNQDAGSPSGEGSMLAGLGGADAGGPEQGASIGDVVGRLTGGAKGMFGDVQDKARGFADANGVDGAIRFSKSAAKDPDLSQAQMLGDTFGGLRSMAGEGLQKAFGDMAASSAGIGTRLDTVFENLVQGAIGKAAPGVSAIHAAEKAKTLGAI